MKSIHFFVFTCIITLFLSGTTTTLVAQNTWTTLSKVVYKKKYFEDAGYELEVPIFPSGTKSLAGSKITLRGYILALEGIKDQEHFMFSLFPFDLCFFCGGAGPETVVEVFTKENKKLKYSSKPVTIKGILELNTHDINRHMYILREVVQID